MKNHMEMIVGLSFCVALLGASSAVGQVKTSEAKNKKIALIRAEINAQIKQLRELERRLIDAVKDNQTDRQQMPAEQSVEFKSGSGLVGRVYAKGRETTVVFKYVHGKVFKPQPLRQRVDGDFVLELRGKLTVPRDMKIEIWHAGGGVNHDVNTLMVGQQQINSVGDNRVKHRIDQVLLKTGVHPVVWRLTGGTFQHNLLKFVDPESGKLIPLEYGKDEIPRGQIKEIVVVGSEKTGWPIPHNWKIAALSQANKQASIAIEKFQKQALNSLPKDLKAEEKKVVLARLKDRKHLSCVRKKCKDHYQQMTSVFSPARWQNWILAGNIEDLRTNLNDCWEIRSFGKFRSEIAGCIDAKTGKLLLLYFVPEG